MIDFMTEKNDYMHKELTYGADDAEYGNLRA